MDINKEIKNIDVPEVVDVLPVNDIIVFPHVILPFHLKDPKHIQLVDKVLSTPERMLLISTIDPKKVQEEQDEEKLFKMGSLAVILKMLKLPDNTTQILVQGIKRAKIKEFYRDEKEALKAKVKVISDDISDKTDIEVEGSINNLKKLVDKLNALGKDIPREFLDYLYNVKNPSQYADLVSTLLDLDVKERQELLETLDVKERLKKVVYYINKEIQVLSVGNKIQEQVSRKLKKSEKDFILREQMKAIQKELGDVDEHTKEVMTFREKIKKAKMPEEVEKEVMRELNRFQKMHADSAEGSVIRTYLETMCEVPWSKRSKDNTNIKKAEKILDDSHYGLKKVKERIVEFLAVQKLKKKITGPILCFSGPPGVGKTSLGKAIAEALNKKYVRMSLGGIHDESEIRGHRKTYIGAMPGRIIQGIKNAGTNNPVFVLDEIDKVSSDFRGDPASALLEVLDPEQNNTFVDHYLNVPYDLSNVMFIATANNINTIPPALRDRIEIIPISGYTYKEKVNIVKKFLLPKQQDNNGIKNIKVNISDATLAYIIRNYTREAGVRNIDRLVAGLCRKIALEVAKNSKKKKFTITKKTVHKYLGIAPFSENVDFTDEVPGLVPGLAWTQYGGEVLYIEAIKRPGKGQFLLTGQLGEVMKESAHIAYSCVKTILREKKKKKMDFSKYDVHVHVPAGAIPKDGPSAGITIATALYSLFTGKPVKKKYAMTGEISLTGRVLPIGGLKEKSLGAYREGYNKVIIPEKNRKDTEEIPEELKKKIKFYPVKRFTDVVKEVF